MIETNKEIENRKIVSYGIDSKPVIDIIFSRIQNVSVILLKRMVVSEATSTDVYSLRTYKLCFFDDVTLQAMPRQPN